MKVIRNLKTYVNDNFHIEALYYYENRKQCYKNVSNTIAFQFYSFRCEFKKLIKMIIKKIGLNNAR
jgi:hypothetical protein